MLQGLVVVRPPVQAAGRGQGEASTRAAATPGTGTPRSGGPCPARPTRSSSPGTARRRLARSQVRYVSNRLSHSRANSRVTVQPGSSPSRLRRMNDWTAVMASSIRLAFSRRPASTSSSSRSLRSPGAVANCPGCQGSGDAVHVAQVGDQRAAAALAQPVVEAPAGPRSGAARRSPGSRRSRTPAGWRCRSRSRPERRAGIVRRPQVGPRRRRCPWRRSGAAAARSQRSACQARSVQRSSARSALVTSYTGTFWPWK